MRSVSVKKRKAARRRIYRRKAQASKEEPSQSASPEEEEMVDVIGGVESTEQDVQPALPLPPPQPQPTKPKKPKKPKSKRSFRSTIAEMVEESIRRVRESRKPKMMMVHMDIQEPLSCLVTKLEEKLGLMLTSWEIYLQGNEKLEPTMTLSEHCVTETGLVQVNITLTQLNNKEIIDILDVVRPSKEYLEQVQAKSEPTSEEAVAPKSPSWIMDPEFRQNQLASRIPIDVSKWRAAHVYHWLYWAIDKFELDVQLKDWSGIDGQALLKMTLEQFSKKVPHDPDNIFWTHLELLRKCNVVAIRFDPSSEKPCPGPDLPVKRRQFSSSIHTTSSLGKERLKIESCSKKIKLEDETAGPPEEDKEKKEVPSTEPNPIVPKLPKLSSSSEPVQKEPEPLWKLLLRMLTDKNYLHVVRWTSCEGVFTITQPSVVARLWAAEWNRPVQSFDMLAKLLDRDNAKQNMIFCVRSSAPKLFKFECDLEQLIGYSSLTLSKLVHEAASANPNC